MGENLINRMSVEKSLVSVIMPCYNQAEYIDDALESLLSQTYHNWECIIINDGSTDNIDEHMSKWLNRDLRIKYFRQENQGVCNTKNNAIKIAKGEFILPLDADDTINPEYIDLCFKNFSEDSLIVYCKSEKFGYVNEKWELDEFKMETFLSSNCIPNTAMFKKEDFDQINGYDIHMKHGFEDWELWINLIRNNNKKVKLIDYYGLNYRIKEISRNTSMRGVTPLKKESFDYIYNKHKDLYDRYFNNKLFLIQEIYHLNKTNNVYKQKLNKIYNNPIAKIYFKIQKLFT